MKLILGSASPRRKDLLAQLGVSPDAILPPDIDEDPRPRELPRPYCLRLAQEKALAVVAGPEDIVLTADTTVALGRRILGKPRDAGEAAEFLLALGGRRHQVITAVAVRRGDPHLVARSREARRSREDVPLAVPGSAGGSMHGSGVWRVRERPYAMRKAVCAHAAAVYG